MSSAFNDYHQQLPPPSSDNRAYQGNAIHSRQDIPSSTAFAQPRSPLNAFPYADCPAQSQLPERSFPFNFPPPSRPHLQQQHARSSSGGMDLNQWIATSPIQQLPSHQFPFPSASSQQQLNNYQLSHSVTSSAGSTASSYNTNSTEFSDDPYSYNNIAHSLPSSSAHATSGNWAPSSAPTASLEYGMYDDFMSSPLSAAGFYTGMAGLGIDKETVSPRELMPSSGTVVDADDFASSPPGAGNDYPVARLGATAMSYPGESGFMMYQTYPNNLFGAAGSPQQATTSPGTDMATQFTLDLDEKPHISTTVDAYAHSSNSPASTIRLRRKDRGGRPELGLMVNSALDTKVEPWPLSAGAAPRPSVGKLDKLFDDGEVEEEDEEDDDDGDGDYVDDAAHHIAGPHRNVRRMSSSAIPAAGKPRRPSPYSRPSRPSARRMSHSDAKDSSPKKVKAVKWESTKPKYWIPEGFDPWWDQKSRGRGVATVAIAHDEVVDEGSSWPANYLPEDWRELVRGKGNPARPFVCPAVNCGKTFQRSEHAKRHAWSLHTPDAVKVSCPFEGCDHKSTRGDNLKQHIGSHKRKGGAPALLKDARRKSDGTIGTSRRKPKYEEDLEEEDRAWA